MFRRRVYFDFAAASPLMPAARRAYVGALHVFGNPSAPHVEGRAARAIIDGARSSSAHSLSVKADELLFTSGGTESNALAILGTAWTHAITSTIEHRSVLASFRMAEQQGRAVTYIHPDQEGLVSVGAIQEALRPDTGLVSLHHAQSELGVVQSIAEVGRMLRAQPQRPLLHVDAAQTPLWIDAAPHSLQADLVSYDAQKVLGPKGVGILYRPFDIPLSPLVGGGSQERGIRPGTENTAAIAAAGVAFDAAARGRKIRCDAARRIQSALVDGLRVAVPDAVILGTMKQRLPNNVFFAISGIDGDYLAVLMDAEGVAVTPRSACVGSGGGYSEPALEITKDASLARGTVRFSFGPGTSFREAERALRALRRVLPIARGALY